MSRAWAQEYVRQRHEPRAVYVTSPGQTLTIGYYDRDAKRLDVWKGVRVPHREMPFLGPISSPIAVRHPAEFNAVREVMPPVAYLRAEDGTWSPGFYEPEYKIFLRWRNAALPAGTAPPLGGGGKAPVALNWEQARAVVDIDRPTPLPGADDGS